jgi:hypothetical protein
MSQDRPILARADPFFPQWECFCQFLVRQGTSMNFNWSDRRDSNPAALADFCKDEEFKDGMLLLSCRRCHRRWVLSCSASFIWEVNEEDVAWLKNWNRRDLRPRPADRQLLQSIGIARDSVSPENIQWVQDTAEKNRNDLQARFSPLRWTSRPLDLTSTDQGVPCQVTFRDGTICQTAQIIFSLPSALDFKPYRFYDEVSKLEPSPLALSLEVRQKALEAPEITMGCPILFLKGPSGRRYAVGAEGAFFKSGSDLGSQMTADEGTFAEMASLPKPERLPVTLICADGE